MKSLNAILVTSGLLALAGAASAAEPLSVGLSAPATSLSGDVDVTLNVTVRNPTSKAISVLRWELPNNAIDNPSFQVTRDGQPVAYTGRLIKRAVPTAADYVLIEPGATKAFTVELTAGYDMSQNGTYTVSYASKGGAAEMKSDSIYLFLQGRSGRYARNPALSANASTQAVEPGTDSIAFTGNCSASQQTALTTAVADALTYANGSVNYYASTRYATSRFTHWFGPGTRASWSSARADYVAIQDAFANKALTLDCSCTMAGTYAYVFANQPYKIYACPVFWTAPATGTDSKAGTLIHEMSHFTVVAGTQDYVYGQTGAAALAISNPDHALHNADSHEYFSENTPTLP